MTATTIFTPDEIATLEAMYPDRDGWFAYFYILSDRVQEDVGEEVADGMRFLCAIGSRPFTWGKQSPSLIGKYCFAATDRPLPRDEFRNKVPDQAYNAFIWDKGLSRPLSRFLSNWASLSPETRTRLWAEWVEVV